MLSARARTSYLSRTDPPPLVHTQFFGFKDAVTILLNLILLSECDRGFEILTACLNVGLWVSVLMSTSIS